MMARLASPSMTQPIFAVLAEPTWTRAAACAHAHAHAFGEIPARTGPERRSASFAVTVADSFIERTSLYGGYRLRRSRELAAAYWPRGHSPDCGRFDRRPHRTLVLYSSWFVPSQGPVHRPPNNSRERWTRNCRTRPPVCSWPSLRDKWSAALLGSCLPSHVSTRVHWMGR